MKFLAKAFGFRPFGARTRNGAGQVNHASMRLGGSMVMMGCPPFAYRNPKALGQATQCLVLTVRDIDEHFVRAVKAGALVIHEPADTPFGTRRYGVADPEGHEWYFSQKMSRKRQPRRKARDRSSLTRS
jgi:uncharacterized glyoxalase superfamily protein PhnB